MPVILHAQLFSVSKTDGNLNRSERGQVTLNQKHLQRKKLFGVSYLLKVSCVCVRNIVFVEAEKYQSNRHW